MARRKSTVVESAALDPTECSGDTSGTCNRRFGRIAVAESNARPRLRTLERETLPRILGANPMVLGRIQVDGLRASADCVARSLSSRVDSKSAETTKRRTRLRTAPAQAGGGFAASARLLEGIRNGRVRAEGTVVSFSQVLDGQRLPPVRCAAMARRRQPLLEAPQIPL